MPATLLEIAVPSILQALCEWSRPLVLLHFVARSRDGATDASASAGLALTFFNCAVAYLSYGFAGAFDTLTSQAFGSGRRDLIAVDLRILLVMSLVFTVLTSTILLAIAMWLSPAIAPLDGVLVNQFLYILFPSVPATIIWNMLTHWLRAQHRSGAIVVGVVFGASLNVLLNLWLPSLLAAATVQPLVSSVATPFLALSIANTAMVVPVLAQTCVLWCELELGVGSKHPPSTSLGRLRKVLSLGMQGILLTCGEIWAWEIQILFCSVLGPASIAAYTISFNFYSFLVMVPVGLRTGLSAVIGFHIGRGSASDATEALRHGLYYLAVVATVYFVSMAFLGQEIACLFTASPTVQSLVATSLLVIAFYQAFDGLYAVLVGALLGVGKQGTGASATLAFYVLGLPAAGLFAFLLRGGVPGLWLGMGMANIVVCLIVVRRVRAVSFADEVASARAALLPNEEGCAP